MGFGMQSVADTVALMVAGAEATKREAEIALNEHDYTYLSKVAAADPSQLLVAVGYLCAYMVHGNYTRAYIFRNGDDIEASYTSPDGRRFVLGAVWNRDTRRFGFHS